MVNRKNDIDLNLPETLMVLAELSFQIPWRLPGELQGHQERYPITILHWNQVHPKIAGQSNLLMSYKQAQGYEKEGSVLADNTTVKDPTAQRQRM